MTDRRQRRKAHLDQHVRDVNGDYRYVGDWYRLRGGKGALAPFAGAVLLAGASILLAGCITAAGLKNTWYVIFPYVLEVSLLFALVWQSVRLTKGLGRVKAYHFESASPLIPPLGAALAGAAALTAACSVVFLLRQGAEGGLMACAAWFLLKALTVLSALSARAQWRRLVWEKD